MTIQAIARVCKCAALLLAAFIAVLGYGSPAAASQTPTLFFATFGSENPDEEQVAKPRDSLAAVTLRPQVVAALEDAVDASLLDELDIPDDSLSRPGAFVFGATNRPSLLCSTLSVSISSKANACFRDFNRNGDFEQIVRSSVDQLASEILVPDDEGTISGVSFDRRNSLESPIRYRILDDAEAPTFEARLGWAVSSRRDARRGEPVYVGIKVFHDETASSNWEVVSECYQTVYFEGEPVAVPYHGNIIHILGFTERGHLRYRIEPAPDPQLIGFVYQRRRDGSYGSIIFSGQTAGLGVCAAD